LIFFSDVVLSFGHKLELDLTSYFWDIVSNWVCADCKLNMDWLDSVTLLVMTANVLNVISIIINKLLMIRHGLLCLPCISFDDIIAILTEVCRNY